MPETIKNRSQAASARRQHEAHDPMVGDVAPDFELRDVNGTNPVRLSQFQGDRPVALIFGSHT